jgi:CRP-like cAMP-binding protein
MANRLEYLTPNDVALLASKSTRTVFSKDQPIIQEGAMGTIVFFIISGNAYVQRGQGPSAARLATLSAGDVCGEMAFLEGVKSSASVIAGDNVTADCIKHTELLSVFEAFPHLGSRFYRSIAIVLSRRLRETSRQIVAAQAVKG